MMFTETVHERVCLEEEEASSSTLDLAASCEFLVFRVKVGLAKELGEVPHVDCEPFFVALAFVGFGPWILTDSKCDF